MKVTNIEALRNELEKNLNDVFFDADVRQFSKAIYPEQEDIEAVTTLNHPIQFQKNKWDGHYGSTTEATFYITFLDDSIMFWKNDPETKTFKFIHFLNFDNYRNKTLFMMQVAVEVEDLLQ